MKHLVLKTGWNNNMEHGMLRDFEDCIAAQTGAEILDHPFPRLPRFLGKRLAHGTRYQGLRRFLIREDFPFKADVLWVPLMAPEDFQLDVFRGWPKRARCKILYCFDTLPHQYNLIRSIVKRGEWDLLVTSFSCAVDDLQKITGRKWHCVPQGVDLHRFYPRQPDADIIPPIFIASYGRRLSRHHEAILRWCRSNSRWYDYTCATRRELEIPAQDHYQCYAEHVGSAFLSVNFPVEKTNPSRARHLSPITCRWFEAAASGAVLVGEPPKNPTFKEWFGDRAVVPMPENPGQISSWMDRLLATSKELRDSALKRITERGPRWSWESRVQAILRLLGQKNEGDRAS